MTQQIDIAALRKAAQEATPGPWKAAGIAVTAPALGYDRVADTELDNPQMAENAAYIAAANPAVILALLDRLEQAERDATTLRARHGALQMALERAEKERDEVVRAARGVLLWTEVRHRPPQREVIPAGGTARVRIHALADLHDLVGEGMTDNDMYVWPTAAAMQGERA